MAAERGPRLRPLGGGGRESGRSPTSGAAAAAAAAAEECPERRGMAFYAAVEAPCSPNALRRCPGGASARARAEEAREIWRTMASNRPVAVVASIPPRGRSRIAVTETVAECL